MISRILAIGDPHFRIDNLDESNQFINNLSRLIDDRKDIDIIVVLGDILHTHEKLHTVALNSATNFFKMLIAPRFDDMNNRRKIKVFCLVGNHDATSNTIFLTDNHWMNALKGWDGLTIVDYPITEPINNSFITLCPYVPDGRLVEALNHLNTLEQTSYTSIKIHDSTTYLDWKLSSCVFAHQLLDGAKMGPIVASNVEEWKDEYPLCVSGHIHDKQKIKDNLYYVGSSMQHSYGENGDKSLAIITIVEGEEPIIEEIYLDIKKKKILYATIEELEDVQEKILENQDIEYKIVLKGKDSDLKAIKQSALYKETMELDNVKKISFKATWKDEGEVKVLEDDFIDCLQSLVYRDDNPYLSSLYEHLIYGKEDKSDQDIFFFTSEN
jgi:DNA repair exonuclease SbcCD nuclease subunit